MWPLILFAAEHGLPLRFIELMPLSRTDVLTDANFLPVTEVMEQLRAREHLIPQPDHRLGHGPAKYYRLERTGALVGFIGAITNQHFCETCNRVRLTADGKIRPCLGNHGEVDLRTALRHHASEAELAALCATPSRRNRRNTPSAAVTLPAARWWRWADDSSQQLPAVPEMVPRIYGLGSD